VSFIAVARLAIRRELVGLEGRLRSKTVLKALFIEVT
jgi:hypothetical protein